MTDIERIAREAGFDVGSSSSGPWVSFEDYDCTDEVKALIALVAAECARVCELRAGRYLAAKDGSARAAERCAEAIRERFGA
jgi:hypothetical protein